MTRKEEIRKEAEEYYNEVKYLSDLSAFPIAAFKAGAEWADKTMLDKICGWLKEHMHFTEGIANGEAYYQCNSMESFLNELKQTMEQ